MANPSNRSSIKNEEEMKIDEISKKDPKKSDDKKVAEGQNNEIPENDSKL